MASLDRPRRWEVHPEMGLWGGRGIIHKAEDCLFWKMETEKPQKDGMKVILYEKLLLN